jgi:hypothetical protein
MAWIGCAHHIFGIKHLLRELRHGQSAVLLRAARRKWSEASHEKVESREWHQVHGDLAKVAVQLPGEAEAARDP